MSQDVASVRPKGFADGRNYYTYEETKEFVGTWLAPAR